MIYRISAAFIVICAAMAFGSPASAQDSMDCISAGGMGLAWETDSGQTYEWTFTNNCGWPVSLHWRTNQFGQYHCGEFDQAKLHLDPGESYTPAVRQVRGTPRMRWCGEAYDRDHPDYNTCPSGTQSGTEC